MLAPLMLPDFLLRSMVFLSPLRNPLRSISSPLRKLRLFACLFLRCFLAPQIFSIDAYSLLAFPSPFLPCSLTGKLFLCLSLSRCTSRGQRPILVSQLFQFFFFGHAGTLLACSLFGKPLVLL